MYLADLGGAMEMGLIGALVGGVIGGLIGLVRWLVKGGKKKG